MATNCRGKITREFSAERSLSLSAPRTSDEYTTNLFERELVAHLIEKYRSLIETYPPKRRILGGNRSVFEQTTKTSSHACKPVDVHMAQSQ
jgi:hypothetical protein